MARQRELRQARERLETLQDELSAKAQCERIEERARVEALYSELEEERTLRCKLELEVASRAGRVSGLISEKVFRSTQFFEDLLRDANILSQLKASLRKPIPPQNMTLCS